MYNRVAVPCEFFYRYSDYLYNRYGRRTFRVSVDAGFSCPGRESGRPCIYCDARGSRSPYIDKLISVREQVERGIEFLKRRYRASAFLLYFQANTNTFAPVSTLARIYDEGLSAGDFRGLVVATRPDCVPPEVVHLLASYRSRGYDVLVELGLQSAHDETLRAIRRGHTVAAFDDAVRRLRAADLEVAAHVILGLPGEGTREAAETALHLAELDLGGVKLHNLVAVENTEVYRLTLAGGIAPPGAESYLELAIAFLEHLPRDVPVFRLTFDPPRGLRALPPDRPRKEEFYRNLVTEMRTRRTYQGHLLP